MADTFLPPGSLADPASDGRSGVVPVDEPPADHECSPLEP